MRKSSILAAALAIMCVTPAFSADKYVLDASHSQVVFSYNHLGFSTSYGMFSGFEGQIMFDEGDPAASTVSIEIPTDSLISGWDERTKHLLSQDFFTAEFSPVITFNSTSIEVTSENTANITGDLTLNGVTKSVVLAATMNQAGEHPMAKKPWLGFSATTTLIRSEYDMGMFAPFVGDEVMLMLSIEAQKAE
ncbi:MAG: YceI family protein [Paracoccaceae bacterium]